MASNYYGSLSDSPAGRMGAYVTSNLRPFWGGSRKISTYFTPAQNRAIEANYKKTYTANKAAARREMTTLFGYNAGYPRRRAFSGAMTVRRRTTIPSKNRGFTRIGGFYRGAYGQQALPGEMKFHDVTVNDVVVASAGTINPASASLNIIAQNNTESGRVGRKSVIRAINWRYMVAFPSQSSLVDNSDTVRMILYQDKQCNGATASVADILETAAYQSFNNLANKNRFRILCDKTVDVYTPSGAGDGTTNDGGEFSISGSFYKKCNIPIEFDNSDPGGILTSQRSNNLAFLFISRRGKAAIESKVRLRFTDS